MSSSNLVYFLINLELFGLYDFVCDDDTKYYNLPIP